MAMDWMTSDGLMAKRQIDKAISAKQQQKEISRVLPRILAPTGASVWEIGRGRREMLDHANANKVSENTYA